jgi:hypothetical protein
MPLRSTRNFGQNPETARRARASRIPADNRPSSPSTCTAAFAEPGAQAFQAGQRTLAGRRLVEQMRRWRRAWSTSSSACRRKASTGAASLQPAEMLAQQAQETPLVGRRLGEIQGQRRLRAVVVRQTAACSARTSNCRPCSQPASAANSRWPAKASASACSTRAGSSRWPRSFPERRKAFADRATRPRRAADHRPARCRCAGAGRPRQGAEAPRRSGRTTPAGSSPRPASRARCRQGGQRRLHGRPLR